MGEKPFSDALGETDIMVLRNVLAPSKGMAFLMRCIALGSVAGSIGLFSVPGPAHADLGTTAIPEDEKPQSTQAAAPAAQSSPVAQRKWNTVEPSQFIYRMESSKDPVTAAQPQVSSKQEFLKQQGTKSAGALLKPAATPVIAQAAAAEDTAALRKRMAIDPLEELLPVSYTPGSSVGVPTAFGANFGDAFVGLSFSSRRDTVGEADGAITAGFGLGDSERYVGLEVSTNIGSLRRFSANGDIGFKLHRVLPGKAAIAIGWDEGITWGDENRNTVSTLYGVASKIFDLRPDNVVNSLPLTVTLGLGGGRFRSFENIRDREGGVGVFGSVGLRVVPQASVIASWTGRDLNLGVSYVPIRTTPLYLTAVVGNVLGRNDNSTLFSFGIGYGFNYAGYQY